MTDIETMRGMLSRAGVVFEIMAYTGAEPRATEQIICVARVGPNNLGYAGVYTALFFAADGALVAVGAWP